MHRPSNNRKQNPPKTPSRGKPVYTQNSRAHSHTKKPSTAKEKSVEGIVRTTSRGRGFVESELFDEDIEILDSGLGVALDGDLVTVKLLPKRGTERQQGEVVQVLKRSRTNFVGTLKKENGTLLVIPDGRKLHVPFKLISKEPNLVENFKVYIRLSAWTDPKAYPEATLIKVLGPKGVNDVEMEAILLERGFATAFPPEVERDAEKIKAQAPEDFKKEVATRRDLRSTTTFTIDPHDAKDFDDAISVKKLPDNEYEIGVHIADVSHYLTPKSALDMEAQKRGTSIYLVDRTIPMLPEVLSNDLCSLKPNEDKLAFSAMFTMTTTGEIRSRWFGRTIINSNKRFTYEEAQEVLTKGTGPYHEELTVLNSIAKIFTKARHKAGAISFEQDEVKFELDGTGKPVRVFRKQRLDTHKLVEEWMLLANQEVATFVSKLGKGSASNLFIYRIHDLPNREKITELGIFLKAIGYELKMEDGKVSGKDINALFKQLEGEAEEGIVKTTAIRSMAKAIYSTKNIGHFGLAFNYYTHFTSPIRRYPDVMVHRLLQEYLDGKKISSQEFAFYEKMATQNTESEIKAAEAERDSIKLKQVEYMSERIGQTFTGIISGVTEWGIYVEDKETKCEGMVRLRDMSDDYYTLDVKNYALIGQRTKKKYSLGDEVQFKVAGADAERKTLDYTIL